MTNIAPLVANQVFIMLILVIVGFVLTKRGLISEKGSHDISNILLTIVTPCVIINAYQIDFKPEVLKEIIISFAISIMITVLGIVIAKICFIREPDREKSIVKRFTSIYSNCGFMGIPLLEATMGAKGVLIGSAYLATFNIFVWTHGLSMYSDKKERFKITSLLKNPGVMGVVIAMILFFSSIRLTGAVKACVGYIGSMNTPLAMVLLGTYLARSNLYDAVKNKSVLTVSFVRLILIPVISILILKLLNADSFILTSLILSAACPAAAICAMFAQKTNHDTSLPSQIVSVSTVLSLITLPFIAYLTNIIL